MPTATITLQALTAGTYDLATVTALDTDTGATFTLDRTVALGLNATLSATTNLANRQSNDSGVTWTQFVAGDTVGGGTDPAVLVWTQLRPGTSRQVRATLVVTGLAVTVSGSLVTA